MIQAMVDELDSNFDILYISYETKEQEGIYNLFYKSFNNDLPYKISSQSGSEWLRAENFTF